MTHTSLGVPDIKQELHHDKASIPSKLMPYTSEEKQSQAQITKAESKAHLNFGCREPIIQKHSQVLLKKPKCTKGKITGMLESFHLFIC